VQETPKRIKRLVREWAVIAHERGLRTALGDLRGEFDRWARGELTTFDLNELVHRYHQDTSLDLWTRYATTQLEPAVAHAVAAGIIRKDEPPQELIQHIATLIELYEHHLSGS
jgi:hypothetical protein